MQPNLADPDLYANGIPHDVFAALRRAAPVYFNPEPDGPGFYALTRHADIAAVSRDPVLFSSAHDWGGHRLFNENEVGLTSAGESAIGIPFISQDPPAQTAYRRAIMPALSPARLEGIEARVAERARALIAALPDGAFDLVAALAAPLPLLTLAELLGVPAESWPDLFRWTNAFVGEDDPDFRQSPEAMAALMGEFFAWAGALHAARRAEPGPDIASLLVTMGEGMALRDFLANLILVLVGGNETTRNSIAHTVIAFARDPAQWDAVRADPGLLRTGVREMVRHATPVLHMRRTATADTEISGVRVPRGAKVVLWYAGANFDEAVFEEPLRFDVRRQAAAHLGFGIGTHACVGARLAELQLRVVFSLLAERVARFELAGDPVRFRSNFIHGLKALPVQLRRLGSSG